MVGLRAPREASRARSTRQREVKRRPAIDGRLRPDLSTMPVNDSLDGGEPDPRAGELRLGMQPLKRTEQFRRVAGVESRAVVTHAVHLASGAIGAVAELDP